MAILGAPRDWHLRSDELRGALGAYAARKKVTKSVRARSCSSGSVSQGRRGTRAGRKAAACNAQAVAAMVDAVASRDVAQLFGDALPPCRALPILVERILGPLADMTYAIGPLVRRLSDHISGAASRAGWSIYSMFGQMLLPSLASMRKHKTRTYGVIVAITKAMWSPGDWPDPDPQRAEKLRLLVADHFLDGQDMLTGVWCISHLRLDCFTNFEDFFNFICKRIQALRLYCVHAPLGVQRRVVESLVVQAGSVDRQERRRLLSAAAGLIERLNLDKNEFPAVARNKLKRWLGYMVHRVPLQIAEDYAYGDSELLSILVQQLHRAGNTSSAALLYQAHVSELDGLLEETLRLELQDACHVAAPLPDVFGPHMTAALELSLPEERVIWVDTPTAVTDMEVALRCASVVGVDLEWSSKGEWLDSTLALMQVATPSHVYLVDLAEPRIEDGVGTILRILLGASSPLLVGFAFHHDLRELSRSPWALQCRHPRGLCDLQAIGCESDRESLAKLVQRLLGWKFCKAEQKSYWHRRPLRAAQRHYAALDAYVLLQLGSALTKVPLSEPENLASKLAALVAN